MQEANQHISFSVLQQAIRQARYNALKAANAELVNLYWQVGAFVSKQLGESKWGDKTVQQLVEFLQKEDPALKGFDKRNIYRMVEFYEKYKFSAIVVSVKPQLQKAENQRATIVPALKPLLEQEGDGEFIAAVRRQFFEEDIRQTLLAKIGWTHNKTIFSRCRTAEEREFYLRLCIKENYSSRELERQIDSGIFERVMMGNQKLSPIMRQIHPDIINSFKDSYVFEFLNLPEPHNENDLQKGLIQQMKKFILELGKDFCLLAKNIKCW